MHIRMFGQQWWVAVSKNSRKAISTLTIAGLLLTTGAPALVFAADSGFLSPTAKDGNHTEWSDAENAFSSNNVYSTETNEDDDQSFENFGFSVPTGSTIDGIEMIVEGFSSDSSGCQIQPRMWSDSDNEHSDRKNQAVTGSDAAYTLGSPTDLWGSTWVADDFSNTNFHAEVEFDDVSTSGGGSCSNSSTFSLDHIQVKVYYTEAEPTEGDYVLTGDATITDLTVDLAGTASADPFVGQLNDQHISIDWDDDGDGIANTWETEDSNSSGNDDGDTANITFDIDSFDSSGNDKFFTENDWSATHTYSTPGSKKIFARLHHATTNGNEGSDISTIEIDVIVVEPDTDADDDGINDDEDNCPSTYNPDQTDTDGDGVGDACDDTDDTDTDEDGIPDVSDNCPTTPNADQTDTDGDGVGDACDEVNDNDVDEDGVPNEDDNCPFVANADQTDTDGDGIGDACDDTDDTDTDEDGIPDVTDNCDETQNPDQADSDEDGTGDACEVAPTPGTLYVIKNTFGGNGTFEFNVGETSTTSVTTEGGTGMTESISLAPGSYALTEVQQSGWDMTGVSCEYGGESDGVDIAYGEQITIASGYTVTCTFTNTKHITVKGYKWNDLNNNNYWDGVHGDTVAEPALSDWTIQAMPQIDSESEIQDPRSPKLTTTNENGYYKFSFSSTDGGWWVISEEQQTNWTQTFPYDWNELEQKVVRNSYLVLVTPGEGLDTDDLSGLPSHYNSEYGPFFDFGNFLTDLPDCSDGIDNDGDGKTDYPADGDCSGPEDDNGGEDAPAPTSGGGGGGGGGGGNGNPSDFGVVNGGGQVLGASTLAPIPGEQCSQFINAFMGPNRDNDPEQVKRLQQVLLNEGFAVEVNGVFDDATLEAVKAFQKKYADDVLTPWGISEPTGYVYLTTRKKLNELYCIATGQTFPLSNEEQAIIDNYKKGIGGGMSGSTTGTIRMSAPTEPEQEPTTEEAPVEESQVGAAAGATEDGGFWGTIRGFFGF